MTASPPDVLDLETFRFRGLHPLVLLGTASDRYAGWLGQIYSPERFAHRISRRPKTLGKRKFIEEVLPTECVEEYFEHFPVLELDYTFYGPLLDEVGNPTTNFHALAAYRRHLHGEARLLVKAPRAVSAQRLRRGGRFEVNPDYLNPGLFTERFLGPAQEILGPALAGVLFEQEYQRQDERVEPSRLAAEWDRFFSAVPSDDRYHVEFRTEAYLVPAVFNVLERHGVGHILSHWTWLPSLCRQFEFGGRRFLNRGGDCVMRLMTPHNVRYEDAYAAAHPFNRLVEGMLDPGMVREAANLMRTAVERGERIHVIVNNRAGGNAPLIARSLAQRFLQGDLHD